ncbi:hypothetical protein [Enemella evansiae]|uniref:hypothetical protein n=1 Tax=Enemella evansiae TaxID=2016499 RepID=UPI00105B2149|nr:hypothetical protein [Enemella evansiae]TDO93009.1 hypothetical protein C8D81_0785 [Enemella evansiae]
MNDWLVPYLADLIKSPAVGGVAAVIAAAIAWFATKKDRRHRESVDKQDREDQRNDWWWQRAQWALSQTRSDDPRQRELGYLAIATLAGSEWVSKDDPMLETIRAALPPEVQ